MRSELLVKEHAEDQPNLDMRANVSSVPTVIGSTAIRISSSTARKYIGEHAPVTDEGPDVLTRELVTPRIMRRNLGRKGIGRVSDPSFKGDSSILTDFQSCATQRSRALIEGYVDWHYRRMASNAARRDPSTCEDSGCRPIGTHLTAA